MYIGDVLEDQDFAPGFPAFECLEMPCFSQRWEISPISLPCIFYAADCLHLVSLSQNTKPF